MTLIAFLIIVTGFPFSLLGFFLTRAYCRALSEQPKKPLRASRRADVLNSGSTVIIS